MAIIIEQGAVKKLNIIYNNRWRNGTILGQSSQNPQHPATDTQIDTKVMFWRTTTDGETAYISNDLGNSYEIKYLAILNHNIPATAVIKIISASNSAFTLDVTETTVTRYATNIWYKFPVSQTKRYWKLQVTNPANADGYIQVAVISLSPAFVPNRNYGREYQKGKDDFSEIDFSDSVILFSQEKPKIVAHVLEFTGLDDASQIEILALLEECGVHKSFIVCFDPDNPQTTSYYVRNEDIAYPVTTYYKNWNWSLNVREVL